MSLTAEFFTRPTNITAKVICDSLSPDGKRLTTLEIEYPRFIHAEFMTHRMLSKNSSSSRAIPIQKMLEQIESNMAVPLYWGKAKNGMQAGEEVSDTTHAKRMWKSAFDYAKDRVDQLFHIGLHKQVPNRLLEPFQMMKVVVTGTEWDNFFNLRIHPDAQPEIAMLAYKIYQAMEDSKPVSLKAGEWHLPFINLGWNGKGEVAYFDEDFNVISLETAIKISAASCAAVSYRTEGMTLEKADKIFDMLIKADVIHASPLEHLATPIKPEKEIENSDYLTVGFENKAGDSSTWENGVTHVNKQGELCSGNLVGFIQYRHTLQGNTAWKFDFTSRMEMFNV